MASPLSCARGPARRGRIRPAGAGGVGGIQGRRDNLTLSSEATSGPAVYLADVDADQVDAQIATLGSAIQVVTAHKNTLP